MSHHSHRSGYSELTDRLNRCPQGAPPSESLYRILKILFSEREAELIAVLPIKPFTAEKAAEIWKMDLARTRNILDDLAGRAMLVDIEGEDGQTTYVLPPPMAGFFEFSMMRTRGDIDQKALGELFYQYLNVEEDFIKALFVDGETQLGRVFVQEPMLSRENAVHVLDYERASEVIRTASHRAISTCYCRHKMEHVGRDCDAPKDICMTFNTSAAALARHGHARPVDTAECLDLLDQAQEHGLVQFGENVRERVNFICNCCGCCCEAMIAARKFGNLHPVHTTNFLPVVDEGVCNGCGKCAGRLPGRSHEHRLGQRPEAAQAQKSPRGRKHLSGLRRLRTRLSGKGPAAQIQGEAGHHPAQFRAPHRGHGPGARQASAPLLRQSCALEPPRPGRSAGRHP